MSGAEKTRAFYAVVWLISTVFHVIAAFVLYPARDALIFLFVFDLLIALATLSGLVPIGGPFIYWWLATSKIVPLVFTNWFPELQHTWLVTFDLYLGLFGSIGYTLMVVGGFLAGIAGQTASARAVPVDSFSARSFVDE